MSKRRPYIYQDREWLEIAQIQEKQDVQGDEVPLSEVDQPYRFAEEDDDFYGNYEWDYVIPPYPGPGPGPDPVPIPGPCNQETKCGFVTLVDVPETIECEEEYWFRTIHSVAGCESASFEDAFLSWSLTGPGELIPQAVGAKYIAPENNDGAEVTVCVSSVDGSCSDCRTFTIDCAVCCEQFEIVGADTVNANSTWQGAIDPPCPGATCTVSSNAGCPMTCEVNTSGTVVSVPVGIKNCGSFTVSVTEDVSTPQKIEDNCTAKTASKTVRINDNSGWILCGGSSFFLCNGPFCSCDFIAGQAKWTIWIGAGIFCGSSLTLTCYKGWPPPPPVTEVVYGPNTYFASSCDTNGPCAGSSLWGVSLWYWGNENCECF